MSSSCLSAATIVRCGALSKNQNGVIFIPVVVQIIFLFVLTAVHWRSGKRKHFWIFAEGWAFYTVALLDLLAHILTQPRQELQVFRIFDIVTGALSSVPILLYTIFLFVFSKSLFLPNLPRLARTITKYALLLLIPITVAMSELGSFLGVSHRLFQNNQGDSLLAIGFATSRDETLWQFFTSVTLVLLTIYQVFTFIVTMYLIMAILHERRIGRTFLVGTKAPKLNGVAWVSIGVKLGALESVLGFVNGGFTIVIVRRILRLLSRCTVAYGSVYIEDSTVPERTGRGRSRTVSQIRAMISNPRTSTFLKLSPTAAGFTEIPPTEEMKYVEGTAKGGPIPRPQRVTVSYDGRSAPSLNLRLSDLKVPTAEELTAVFQRRGTIIGGSADRRMHGNWESTSTRKSRSTCRSLSRSLYAVAPPSVPNFESFSLPQELQPVLDSRGYTSDSSLPNRPSSRPNPRFRQDTDSFTDVNSNSYVRGHARFMSGSSLASDSLSIFNSLAAEFPGIPPRRTASGKRINNNGYREFRKSLTGSVTLNNLIEHREKEEKTISPSNSIKRKPPPVFTSSDPPPPPPNDVLPQDGNNRAISGVSGASAYTFGAAPQQPRQQRSQESLLNSKSSHSSSLKRKIVHIPPPIDSVIARSDAMENSRYVEVSSESAITSTFDEKNPHSQSSKPPTATTAKRSSMRTTPSTIARGTTPGMTLNTGSSVTSAEIGTDIVRNLADDGAEDIDPFSDSDMDVDGIEFRASELAAAESGLGRIASKVAQYDRMRRQAYRGVDQPSPIVYSPFGDDRPPHLNSEQKQKKSRRLEKGKGKEKEQERGKEKIAFPQQSQRQQQQFLSISRPRPLSAQSSSTTGSYVRNASIASPTSVRRVTVSARRGPAFSNASSAHALSASASHSHSTSVTSTGTHRSHIERELMRVKSVGRVTTRRTPVPTPSTGSFVPRNSMKIDSIDFSASSGLSTTGTESAPGSPSHRKFRGMFRDGDSTTSASTPTSAGGSGIARSPLRGTWNAESDSEVERPRPRPMTRSDLRS